MHRPPAVRVIAAAGALSVLLAALAASSAWAGQFTVASCQADQLNFSTTAFADFATRGMKIVRACNPEGPGLRGLITANVVQAGSVPRGAASIATINAPVGTTFTTLRWAGTARRRDCRYALQLYADVPGGAPIPIKNVRANQRCSPGTARAGGGLPGANVRRARRDAHRAARDLRRAPRTRRVLGARRQLHPHLPGPGRHRRRAAARRRRSPRTRRWPRAHGSAAPSRCTTTPRTTSASAARTRSSATSDGGSDQRPCSMATPERRVRRPRPVPERPGQITVDTHKLPGGHAAARRPGAGHGGESRDVGARRCSHRQHAPGPGGRGGRRRRRVAQPEQLHAVVVEPERSGSRADRRRDRQAVPGRRRRRLQSGRAGRRRHREPARPGPGARRVDGLAVPPGRGRQSGPQRGVGPGDAAL